MGISVILYLAFLATYFGWTQFSLLGGICLGFNSLTPFRRKIIGKRARMTAAKFYIKYVGPKTNLVDKTNSTQKIVFKKIGSAITNYEKLKILLLRQFILL